jgi:hypothetical protein
MGMFEQMIRLSDGGRTITENLGFILKELPKLEVSQNLKNDVAAVCHPCELEAYSAREEIRNLAGYFGASVFSVWHRSDASKTIELIEENLEKCTQRMHPLVKKLEALSRTDQDALYILVAESAVNMLAEKGQINEMLAALKRKLPPELPGRAVRASDQYVLSKAIFRCSVCTAVAGAVIFPPTLSVNKYEIDQESGSIELLGALGSEQSGGESQKIAKLLNALSSDNPRDLYSVDELWAPFYCPACANAYCKNHLVFDVRYDDSFYDATFVTCPQNHKRMVDD